MTTFEAGGASLSERVAVIDLGSNSARLITMDVRANGSYNLIYHQKETIRLGEGVQGSNRLQPEPMRRALQTLAAYAARCRLLQADTVIAVATAAVRKAANREQFLQQVQAETGLELQVLSGEEEAWLGSLGVINTLAITDALIFDLGGGSMELSLIQQRQLACSASLPWGTVSLTEQFGTADRVNCEQLRQLTAAVREQLEGLSWARDISVPLVGVGGTARNLAKMVQQERGYPFARVHGYEVTREEIAGLQGRLAKSSVGQRRRMPGLSKDRADIIVAGAAIIDSLFQVSRSPVLMVSGCGLREGLFLQHYLRRQRQGSVLPDVLQHSAKNILQLYDGNLTHGLQVAELACQLFDGWQQLHGLTERFRELLWVSALLHDVGIFINYYDHPRHSAYLLENARLFGLTHREQMICSVVAGWHEGVKDWFRVRRYQYLLDEADWAAARRLALLVALAEALDTTETQAVVALHATHDEELAAVALLGQRSGEMELAAARQLRKWVQKELGRRLHLFSAAASGSTTTLLAVPAAPASVT